MVIRISCIMTAGGGNHYFTTKRLMFNNPNMQSVSKCKESRPCGRNKQKQSSRRSAWYTQQSWCHFLCAAAPGIWWSNPRSFGQHLQPPSGYHTFGHIESGTLCGFSLERRHSGNINLSTGAKTHAKTKLGNTRSHVLTMIIPKEKK